MISEKDKLINELYIDPLVNDRRMFDLPFFGESIVINIQKTSLNGLEVLLLSIKFLNYISIVAEDEDMLSLILTDYEDSNNDELFISSFCKTYLHCVFCDNNEQSIICAPVNNFCTKCGSSQDLSKKKINFMRKKLIKFTEKHQSYFNYDDVKNKLNPFINYDSYICIKSIDGEYFKQNINDYLLNSLEYGTFNSSNHFITDKSKYRFLYKLNDYNSSDWSSNDCKILYDNILDIHTLGLFKINIMIDVNNDKKTLYLIFLLQFNMVNYNDKLIINDTISNVLEKSKKKRIHHDWITTRNDVKSDIKKFINLMSDDLTIFKQIVKTKLHYVIYSKKRKMLFVMSNGQWSNSQALILPICFNKDSISFEVFTKCIYPIDLTENKDIIKDKYIASVDNCLKCGNSLIFLGDMYCSECGINLKDSYDSKYCTLFELEYVESNLLNIFECIIDYRGTETFKIFDIPNY